MLSYILPHDRLRTKFLPFNFQHWESFENVCFYDFFTITFCMISVTIIYEIASLNILIRMGSNQTAIWSSC